MLNPGYRPRVAFAGMPHRQFCSVIAPATSADAAHTWSVIISVPDRMLPPALQCGDPYTAIIFEVCDVELRKAERSIIWVLRIGTLDDRTLIEYDPPPTLHNGAEIRMTSRTDAAGKPVGPWTHICYVGPDGVAKTRRHHRKGRSR